ncbi:MAG: phosphatase PAP2 family protein [Oscillospiraceae bacterium]|nr:phosphatase PAP2 family protein [Oscillospiraceae bacterium]
MKSNITWFILLKSLLLFIIVTVLVVTENTPTANFNHAFYLLIAERIHPTLTAIATWIGNLTHWYGYTPVILFLLILPRTRMKAGLPIASVLSVSAILGPLVLKNIFAIERPAINQLIAPGGFGYPSGHSMNAAVFFGACAIVVLRHSKNKALKIGFTTFAIFCILLVGLSRIYLGVHTVTDVIGGYLAGSVVLCAAILIETHIRRKTVRKTETAL